MSDTPDTKKADDAKPDELKEDDAVVTVHSIKVASGETIPYTVHCGRLPIKNDKGEIEALIFFQAYIRDLGNKPTRERPLMFSFNGGPGSASVWLHLGALGPKRAALNPDGSLPPPPYSLEDNPLTWLAHSDLVFIDPVGTGYSKAKDEETAKKFWSVDGDIQSLTEFIRLFLSRYERWNSPLYMVGESYGTTTRGRSCGRTDRAGDRTFWLASRLDGAQLPDSAVRDGQRPAVSTLSSDLRSDSLVPQKTGAKIPQPPGGEVSRRSRGVRRRRVQKRALSGRPPEPARA